MQPRRYRKTLLLLLAFVMIGVWSSAGLSAHTVSVRPPGDLDSTFDEDGIVITEFPNQYWFSSASSVVVQPNGHILVGGRASQDVFDDFSFALARYRPDGSPDQGFSQDGSTVLDFTASGISTEYIESLLLQPDGKIIAVGHTNANTTQDIVLVRYRSDGALDSTFGQDGIVFTDFEGGGDNAYDAKLRYDGKIVVVGSTWTDSGTAFAVARYDSDGSLDSTFSGDGMVTIPFPGYVAVAFSVDIGLWSNIVVAGYVRDEEFSTYDFAVANLSEDGSLGTQFTTDFSGGYDVAYDLVIQPDHKLLVSGTIDGNFALARYYGSGTLDISFSDDGWLTTAFNGTDGNARTVAVQSDGKIVVAGWSLGDVALARYSSNGTLDTSFSGDGRVLTDINAGMDGAQDVALQSDGKIVVAGYTGHVEGFDPDFAILRYEGVNVPATFTPTPTSIPPSPTPTETVTNTPVPPTPTNTAVPPGGGDTYLPLVVRMVATPPATPTATATPTVTCSTLDREPNNLYLDADNNLPLCPGVTTNGAVSRTSDVNDIYRIEVEAGGGPIEIHLTDLPDGADYDLYLDAGPGNNLAYSTRTGSSDESIVWSVPPGRYYIRVVARQDGNPNGYRLRWVD